MDGKKNGIIITTLPNGETSTSAWEYGEEIKE